MKRWYGLWVVFALILFPKTICAQTAQYGVGILFDRTMPMQAFKDRYKASQIYGVVFDYRINRRVTMTFEYHHSSMKDGKIERLSFTWPIDKQEIICLSRSVNFTFSSTNQIQMCVSNNIT